MKLVLTENNNPLIPILIGSVILLGILSVIWTNLRKFLVSLDFVVLLLITPKNGKDGTVILNLNKNLFQVNGILNVTVLEK